MNPGVSRSSFFIGWDVGGWNCDQNRKSRDAIVILNGAKATVGTPWRGNLTQSIITSEKTGDWLGALFEKCRAPHPNESSIVTMAIDTPLGFPYDFANLITCQSFVEPDPIFGRNRYLFRHTERQLFERGKKPLSAVAHSIGSQATKGMHVRAKFASKAESCGVWTDGDCFRVIETYPAAVRDKKAVKDFLVGQGSLGHPDKDDAHICALIAYLFANERHCLTAPTDDVPVGEGWIWSLVGDA